MSLIYTPKGRAGEYAALACNIYSGCDHRCEYCYAPRATHKTVDTFRHPAPRENFLPKLQREAEFLTPTDQILLCFTCISPVAAHNVRGCSNAASYVGRGSADKHQTRITSSVDRQYFAVLSMRRK